MSSANVACILLTARDEAAGIAETLHCIREAFPGARLWVADDCSTDATAAIALAAGARLASCKRRLGKGGAATYGARAMLAAELPQGADGVVVLCDGDLGRSAGQLARLVEPVIAGEADIATAAFARQIGGGFGLTVGLARRCASRNGGPRLRAPLSGQRAIRARALRCLLPFAAGFGMEVGIAIDAARDGLRSVEVEIDLDHRATGRTISGFAHRGRQLLDVARAGYARR